MNEGSTVLLFKVMCVIMYIYATATIMSCFPRLERLAGSKLKLRAGGSQAGHSSDESTPSHSA
ncbi:hypothetical protein RY831_10595 [Noviherbaspirillum sp. CPCC 100848]|uniref:Uncharacterized protein n=1 Tax=Noviherbaspirillum album TaxID=3080276 RepID=A0ABU6J836_9BURK|nr:hypothetical protein [Noviherbaspirillum sp. CPCC 100848]MEC4719598.1 hypothetical protein [Noviherbaspirillum sp. CPCC 100848]